MVSGLRVVFKVITRIGLLLGTRWSLHVNVETTRYFLTKEFTNMVRYTGGDIICSKDRQSVGTVVNYSSLE